MTTLQILKPGEFLLVVPELGIRETYWRYRFALKEAISFRIAGYTVRVWNYKDRLVYGDLK